MENLKSGDVRIGNYVAFGDTICIVYEIHEKHFYVKNVDCSDSFKTTVCDLQYVPLDDNWLERLPNTRRADKDDSYGGWLLRVNPLNWIRIKNNAWGSGAGDVELKYVHQLQNLYKILTNLELYR